MPAMYYFRDVRKNLGGVSIERTCFADDSVYQEHDHDYYEIFFITEGAVIHRINGRSVHMAVGSMWMIRPGDVHSLRRSTHTRFASLINIAFDASLPQQLGVQGSVENSRSVLLAAIEQQFLLHQIGELRRSDMTDPEVVRSASWAVILTALSLLMMRSRRAPTAPPPWLERCMAEAGRPEHLVAGLPRLVELSGVSQEHLTREMRRCYDLTPSQYINQLRLDYACSLLRDGRISITAAALKSGFGSATYFNRLFRQVYGCSPSCYRRKTDPSGSEAGAAHERDHL